MGILYSPPRAYDIWVAQTDLLVLGIHHLLEQSPETASKILRNQLEQNKTFSNAQKLSELVGSIPISLQIEHLELAEACAEVWFYARNKARLENLLEQVKVSPTLKLLAAWVALQNDQSQTAFGLLQNLEQDLSGRWRVQYWLLRGNTAIRLKHPDWQDWFDRAKAVSQGLELGHCLMQNANALFDAGQLPAAIGSWSQSLHFLKPDPYYMAWVYHNLGMCTLRENPERADGYFLLSKEQAKRKGGLLFLPRALCGVGASRRVLGEWPCARYAYSQANKTQDPYDQQQANWGLGHTARLSGDYAQALIHFQAALEGPKPHDWLFIEIAAAKLMLHDLEGCRGWLDKAQRLTRRSQTIAAILEAVLSMQSHDEAALQKQLSQIDWNTLWVREERACFPGLFAHLEPKHKVKPLPYAKGLEMRVQAAGVVQVFINNRKLQINSKGRPVEVLLALLELGNQATGEQLTDLLYRDATRNKKQNQQALWANINELRDYLGWAESVVYNNGVFSLDPEATWHYDMQDPQVRALGKFAEGIYSNWIEEVRNGER